MLVVGIMTFCLTKCLWRIAYCDFTTWGEKRLS